jgi:CHASE3 domain sensor protein
MAQLAATQQWYSAQIHHTIGQPMVVLVVRVIPNRLHPTALKHQVLVEVNHIREAHNPQSMQRVLTMVVAMRQALVVVVLVLLVAIVLVVMVPFHR